MLEGCRDGKAPVAHQRKHRHPGRRAAVSLRAAAGFVAILACAGAGVAQRSEAPGAEPPVPSEVAILGASLSNGFTTPFGDADRNRTMRLGVALAAFWPAAKLRDCSSSLLFMNPLKHARVAVKRAARRTPELVMAVDFLFWFGYGAVRGATPQDRQRERLALQRQGLAMLDEFECPIVVGDYPDMTGADARMLSRAQIPSPDALAALNAQLAEWAAERPRVSVFSLARWVAQVKAEGYPVEVAGEQLQLEEEMLLQSDGLHATKLGVALCAHRLTETVDALLPADHALVAGRPALETVLEECRVELPESVGGGR